MKPRQILPGLGLVSAVSVLVAQPTWAQVAQVTSVQLKPTDKGLEVLLQTTGTFAEVLTSSSGRSLITDIPNAQLRLPGGQAFRQNNPTQNIASVTVANLSPNQIRVTVTGKAGVPTAEVSQSPQGLILSLTTPSAAAQPTPAPTPAPAAPGQETVPPEALVPETETEEDPAAQAEEQPIDLVVTAEREAEGYRVPNATTGTRTDTPIRDIPASIQVVPQEVIRDQGATSVRETVRNVSGVTFATSSGNRRENFITRGFTAEQFLNGFRNDFFSARTQQELANIERVEVLKGPASVLFGRAEPSGIINFITKKPLPDPYYDLNFTAGSFDFYRPTVDLSGPLTDDKSLAYRLNIAYENAGSFRDRVQTNRVFFAPTLSYQISDDTTLNLEVSYLNDARPIDRGLVVLSNDQIADIPLSRYLGDPTKREEFNETRATLYFDHRFNSNLSLRSALRYTASTESGPGATLQIVGESQDDRNFPLRDFIGDQYYETLSFQNDLIAKFNTGSVEHTVLLGSELARQYNSFFADSRSAGTIDIFNPSYDFTFGEFDNFSTAETRINSFGIYLQDQIALLENLKLVLGGRFDAFRDESTSDGELTETEAEAFSPRAGIVYQPTQDISLYASYSRSFTPVTGVSANDTPFEPQRGTGYEVGVKTEFLGDRLFSTLAFYNTTLGNVLTEDPNDPTFSIQVGEQRSRGIELDIAGEILPGWNIIASYAYTDAVITNDNIFEIGNRLNNVPYNTASLWTTYEIQNGSLAGLGFGAGVFFVDSRQGDLDNSFEVPSYARTDAAVYYTRGNFRAALNIKNLFDVRYFEGSQSRNQVIPGAPFTVQGTISWQF